MRRANVAMITLACLIAMSTTRAVGLQAISGPNDNNGWPLGNDPRDTFDYVPQDDFVITIGALARAPGSLAVAGLGMTFEAAPLFTNSQTDFTVLPAFAVTHSLETGLDFNWWSTSVDVELSLVPWALTSTGGWLELHPPEWGVFTNPWVTLEGSIGWGPRWTPAGDWSHAFGGAFDAKADWRIPTLWDSSLDLTAESNLDATWAFPTGVFVTNWLLEAGARSVLPLFRDSPAALRAGVTARMFVLPAFGLGFDIILEFRANAFYAYGLVGVGEAGIRAEVGAEVAIGLTLFDGIDTEL